MLSDTMELAKMEKGQLIQLCNALYELLGKGVAVYTQPSAQPFIFSTPNPYTVAPMPNSPAWEITCQNSESHT